MCPVRQSAAADSIAIVRRSVARGKLLQISNKDMDSTSDGAKFGVVKVVVGVQTSARQATILRPNLR